MNTVSNFNAAQELYNMYSTHFSNKNIAESVNTVFSKYNFDCLINENQNYKSSREFLNNFILNNYPNESTIKAQFVNNVLLKSKEHVTIFELNAGNSRVDLCKVNGKSIAYEIKTDLDNPNRLPLQMQNYFLIFEEVYLICSSASLSKLIQFVPLNCGIYIYTQNKFGHYIFKRYRFANKSNVLRSEVQLQCLTKQQLITHFKITNLSVKKNIIINILDNYTSKYINSIFKKCLKDKYSRKWNFLITHYSEILEIDYQWFFKHEINPSIIYK